MNERAWHNDRKSEPAIEEPGEPQGVVRRTNERRGTGATDGGGAAYFLSLRKTFHPKNGLHRFGTSFCIAQAKTHRFTCVGVRFCSFVPVFFGPGIFRTDFSARYALFQRLP
jgi:hypothetical protein